MELAPWTAPTGYRIKRSPRRALSLERPRPLPGTAPGGQDAHDLHYYDSWVDHPGRGLTPATLFSAFRLAEQGYPQRQVDLGDDLVEGDGHARNLFEHRERVVANKPLVVNSGDSSDEAKTAARVLQFAWSRLPAKAAFEHLLRANRYGYAGVEMDWGVIEFEGRSWVVPINLTLVQARRFRIGVMGMLPVKGEETEVRLDDLRLYQKLEVPQGHPLRPGKWITLIRQRNQVARGGLLRTLAPLAMAKRFSFRDWIVLSERYGIPWPIVRYDGKADQESLDLAKQIIENLGSDGGAAVAKDLELEIVKGVDVKTPLQSALIAYCNNEMSKLVNGSTLRNDNSGSGGASYGLGNVHDAVAWDEVRGDGEMLGEALDMQVSAPFNAFNSIKSPPSKMRLAVEPDMGPAEMVTNAVKVKNELGIDVSIDQIRERSGLRPPLDDKDKAPGMVVPAFPTPAGGPP